MINFIILSIFVPSFQKPTFIPEIFIFTYFIDFDATLLNKVYYFLILYHYTLQTSTIKKQKSVK